MWLNSETLEKHYVTNIYSSLKSRVWKHHMPCPLEKTIITEIRGHTSEHVYVIIVFHDVNLLKCYDCFSCCKFVERPGFYWKLSLFSVVKTYLALFTLNSIHNIRKSTKTKNSKTRWKVREDSWLHKTQASQKTDKLRW